MKPYLLALLGLLSAAAAGRADDWPQWMGPQRDNVWRETGILSAFSKAGPKVLWKAKVSNGYSGPAVAGGLVYLTEFITDGDTSEPNFQKEVTLKGKERIRCFDAKTGEEKWKYEYPCTNDVSYPNGPRCTPNVAGGKVYTLGAMGDLYCFDAKTGKIHWSRDLRKDFNTPAPPWGFAAHPLIDGERLVCLVGGEGSVAVAFNKDTGAVIWKALSAKEPGYSPPVIFDFGGKRQLLVWHSESLNSLEPATGKVNWSMKHETANATSIMAPRFLGDKIFLGGWSQKAQLMKVDADNAGAKTVWRGKRDTGVYPVNNTPFLEDGHIYGVCSEGQLRCVRMADGERLWETFAPTTGKEAGSGTAHFVKNGDRFFIFGETGDLVIAKMSPKEYVELSRSHLIEPTSKAWGRPVVWSHPAFADRCIFARNDRELICVSLASE